MDRPDCPLTITDVKAQIEERIESLKQWRKGDERAPHKPLLILLALGRLQRSSERLIPFHEVETDLGRLLKDFGPPRNTRPEYPFWHLQSDGLWEIDEREVLLADMNAAPHRNNPRISVIREVKARGGFPESVFDLLRSDSSLVNQITQDLLERNWPPSLHEDILDSVGFQWRQVTAKHRRDPAFRENVLRIYSHRCAICGWDGKLGSTDLALEAAHLKWHAAGGPDSEDNGIALCSFHHKALDCGAVGFDDQRRILVSQHLHGRGGIDEWLLRYVDNHLEAPQTGTPPPAISNIRWHRREVFRGPARISA